MTQATTVYAADPEKLRPCFDCMNHGRAIWLPVDKMHKRVRNGRVMWYCQGCWKGRKEALSRLNAVKSSQRKS